MRILNTVLLLIVCSASPAYAAAAETVEFQLYTGNVTVAPQYQKIEVIRGLIGTDKISTHYTLTSAGKKTEKDAVFKGEQFKKWLKMVRNTKIQPNMMAAGASAFDVTLIDAKKHDEMGKPSNEADWIDFKSAVLKKALLNEKRD